MSLNILLLDGHTVQAISVARSLKDKGYTVSAFIESKLSYGFVSRYIDKKILSPSLSHSSSVYLNFLFDYLSNNKLDIIIPMYNDSAELLSLNKVKIEGQYHVLCAIPAYDVFITAHDKEKLMDVCLKYNLPHPRTIHLSAQNVEDAAQYVGFPALIKPNISSGARGIVVVNTFDELKEKFPYVEKEFGRSTLQEYVDHTGIYYNVMLYRDAGGKFHESVVIRIMRYFPLKGGTSCYCETIQNDELVAICQKVLIALNWHGFADFDIMETKSGEFKIIEINPRMPASIHAAYISGVNYPEMIVCDLLNLPIPTYTYNWGLSMRFFGLDVMWFIFSSQRFSFSPSWFQFFGKKIYYQDGSIHDPLPMLMGIVSGIIKYLNPSFRKSKLKS